MKYEKIRQMATLYIPDLAEAISANLALGTFSQLMETKFSETKF